jgi:hypothetical protein
MDGFTAPTLRNPTRVAGVSGATELAVGDNHACARVAAGIVCWGDDAAGELGNGPAGSSYMPGPVTWL